MGKFTKTIHFIIFIKLFFINYPYLGSGDEENCCITICPCFRNFKEKLEEENNKLKQEKGTLEEENNKLKQEKGTLEEENKNLKKEKGTLEEENKNLNQEKENLEEEKKNLEEENKNLEEEKKKIEEKENNLLNKENELNQKEKDLENETINLQKKGNLLFNENNKLKEEIKKLEEKINLVKKGGSLNNENKNLELKSQIKQYEKQIQQQKEEIISLKQLIQKLKDELEKLKTTIIIGLNNIGATCYMNATLQCLSNSGKLTEYFLKNYDNKNPNRIMSNEYHKVLINLWDIKNNNKSYSPNSFKEVLSKENPLFAGIAANDSKDLINFLLERFHQELNVIKPNINNINNINNSGMMDQTNENLMLKVFLEEYTEKFNSPISNLFYGILETKSQCLGCNVIKFNFQVYSFLEFPLQQVNQYFFNNGKRPLFTNEGKNPDVDLYECFEYNAKVDLMSGDNQMYCNICNKLLNSYYSTIIYSSPIYLIINLNRGKGAVYECKVNFPEQLNLYNFVTFKSGFTAYGLYAVICHLGPSSMSGHFVAYCRNRKDNQWYLYNDAFVTKCTKKFQYNDGMPYILFYKALTLD